MKANRPDPQIFSARTMGAAKRSAMMPGQWYIALFLILAVGLSACGSKEEEKPLDEVTVQLKWTHTAQFVGYYAAEQNGDYAAEGLEVKFVEGGRGVDPLAPVLSGAAQFGLANPNELMLARAEGKPVRAIATIFRRTPLVFFALAESGITGPQDFVGKSIQVPGRARRLFRTLIANVGVSPDQLTELDSLGVEALYSGEVDVAVGFVTDQVLVARQAGYQINVIFPDDYGVHTYNDLIFTTDDFIHANPDLATRFLRASLKGWTYAVENPTEIGKMVAVYDPDADPSQEAAKMEASLPLVHTGEDHIGWMKPEVWAGMEHTLRQQGILDGAVELDKVYTMEFLHQIYESQEK